MKFLCVPCDKAMTLEQTTRSDAGSVSLVYACPDCGYEFAMLTNAMETRMVSSLGVQIGAEGEAGESKCPFTGMVRELDRAEASDEAGVAWTAGAEARMEALPEFVRPMVRRGIEKFARDQGLARVDEDVLEQARKAMVP